MAAPEFVAEEGTLKGLVLKLEAGELWTIGRDPDLCNIVVEDPKVSRKHLVCRKTPEGIVIENLSETNPVEVNGERIGSLYRLKDGDRVKIGGTVFRFFEEGAPPTYVAPAFKEEVYEPETLFREEEAPAFPEIRVDLTRESRFVMKVIAGPNTGAEFALEPGKEYIIGTDTEKCDIVFYDLSVSRQHAKLFISEDGVITIEDLGSRNGVLIDRERIVGKKQLLPNHIVTLGTSIFLIIDREAPVETIAAPVMEYPEEERIEERIVTEEEGVPVEEVVEKEEIRRKARLPMGALLLTVILAGMVILLGIGMVSLFRETAIETAPRDYLKDIQAALKPFPDVKFTYNKNTGRLFLVGHVSTGVQKNELLYNLRGLTFITKIDDNVVDDESIWQEMNILLSKHPEWRGVTMHAPEPGKFVLTGYLKTNQEAAALSEFINLNFSYLDRLQNLVVVEEQVLEEVNSKLYLAGFNGVTVAFTNGELILTGYIPSTTGDKFNELAETLKQIKGIRGVRSYVVEVSPEQAIIDLNEKYPGRFQVTGFSKHGDVNVNVVINGRILSRGDCIDGYTISSIQPHTIFFEKEGLKYKLDYNKCF